MASKIDFVTLRVRNTFQTVKISEVVSQKVTQLPIRQTFFGEILQLYVEIYCF
jgi:hypothetical protein